MAFGDWVQGNHTDAGSVNSTTLLVGTATAGNSIVVGIRRGSATSADSVTVTDNVNAGNYTQDGHAESADPHGLYVFRMSNVGAGATTLTITFGGAAKTMRVVCGEYQGNFAVDGTPPTNTGNSAAADSGNLTTSATDALIGACSAANATGTWSAGTSYTLRESETATGVAIMLEDQNGAKGAGTYSASATFTGGTMQWAAALVAYKAASSTVFRAGPAFVAGQGSVPDAQTGVASSPTVTQAARRASFY